MTLEQREQEIMDDFYEREAEMDHLSAVREIARALVRAERELADRKRYEIRVTWHDHEPKPGEGRDDLRALLNRGDWSVPWVRREVAALFGELAEAERLKGIYKTEASATGHTLDETLVKLRTVERQLAERDEALREVHDYTCGCDQPGRLDFCVAQPVVVFAVLSARDPQRKPR